ncbi:hypothetical protein BVRB_2g025990 [Beta vulgaris subsp. vulgaris]|uniref:basic leucine zipper 23 n=1 Tax=Beta vulgaris subsp. vulgaris TaxID=3555 RepID=UPI00053F2C67|nr:basic leucine zipper 23 [Beta vulgaris subsp. vulgaris]KMT18454.1 hypothetical protein BVRB_2g025990 [Beta vulgaris subsp. vulgaris]
MDEGEAEPADPAFLQTSSPANSTNDTVSGGLTSVDYILDQFLKHTKTCTHTHTCNPPGPDAAHTHTCYHTHTQLISSEEDVKNRCDTSSLKPRKSLGNREAVRKYREKKKAHTAYLEEEVKKLRLVNQDLVGKLQNQAIFEAEILRLRGLLIHFRGKIDSELNTFRIQNSCNSNADGSSFKEGDYGIQSTSSKGIRLEYQPQVPCFLTQGNMSLSVGNGRGGENADYLWQESCRPVSVDCHVNGNSVVGASDPQLQDIETLVSAKNQSS